MRERARDERVEGLMLERRGSPYATGRRRGDWWKWKVEPHTGATCRRFCNAALADRLATLESLLARETARRDPLRPVPSLPILSLTRV
jgi:hypothetical protein